MQLRKILPFVLLRFKVLLGKMNMYIHTDIFKILPIEKWTQNS